MTATLQAVPAAIGIRDQSTRSRRRAPSAKPVVEGRRRHGRRWRGVRFRRVDGSRTEVLFGGLRDGTAREDRDYRGTDDGNLVHNAEFSLSRSSRFACRSRRPPACIKSAPDCKTCSRLRQARRHPSPSRHSDSLIVTRIGLPPGSRNACMWTDLGLVAVVSDDGLETFARTRRDERSSRTTSPAASEETSRSRS